MDYQIYVARRSSLASHELRIVFLKAVRLEICTMRQPFLVN